MARFTVVTGHRSAIDGSIHLAVIYVLLYDPPSENR